MTLYGPSLVAAFASSNKEDIVKFHSLFNELMKKSTLNTSLLKLSTRTISTRTSKYMNPYIWPRHQFMIEMLRTNMF